MKIRHRSRWQIALRYSGVPSNARLVALMLSTWATADGTGCRPTTDQLVEATGLSRASVFRALDDLACAKLIRRSGVGGRGRASMYTLHIPTEIAERLEKVLGPIERVSHGDGLDPERVSGGGSKPSQKGRKGSHTETPAFQELQPVIQSPLVAQIASPRMSEDRTRFWQQLLDQHRATCSTTPHCDFETAVERALEATQEPDLDEEAASG